MTRFASCAVLIIAALFAWGQEQSSREGLRPLASLVGVWRGTGAPFGSRDDQQKNFWVETIDCGWKFKGGDAWLTLAFDKSKHFKAAEIRALGDKSAYQMTITTVDDRSIILRGELANKTLTLTTDEGSERIVISLLHDNRFLYRKEARPQGKTLYAKLFQVGATKEGVPFAIGAGGPECIVTGGLGTSAVAYMGKTYYVCCSGCRNEFNADPAKYVRDFEAKKRKK